MKSTRSAAITLLAVLIGITLGCNQRPGEKVLARVNGSTITVEDLGARWPEPHGLGHREEQRSVEELINQELLFQQGVKLRMDQDPTYRRELERVALPSAGFRRMELARRVFNTQIAARVEVTYQQGKAYFDQNAQRIGTELHLQYFRTPDRGWAYGALQRIRQGVAFESVAAEVMGRVPVKGRPPYELGFVRWEDIPVEFVEPIYRLKPGEVSELLGSQATGFQVVRLLGTRKIDRPHYPPLSAMVMNRLRDARLATVYEEYLGHLRRQARIETF